MNGGRWERLGLQALATLPLWVAAALVAVFARDLAEVAAAVIAGAGLMSLVGLLALIALSRRVRQAGERHGQVVTQSLALLDCMKDMHRRVAEMEAEREPQSVSQAALVMTAELGLPPAGNDALAHISASGSAGEIVTVPIFRLADGTRVAKVVRWRGAPVDDAVGLSRLLAAAAHEPVGMAVEFALPLALLRQAEVVATIESALTGGGPSLLLLADQAGLCAATRDEARALTRLTRHGLRLALTGLAALDASPEALGACAVSHVHATRAALLAAARDNAQRTLRWSDALARQDIRLIVDGIGDGRDSALLAALGASFGQGALQDTCGVRARTCDRPRPAMPWRATRLHADRAAI